MYGFLGLKNCNVQYKIIGDHIWTVFFFVCVCIQFTTYFCLSEITLIVCMDLFLLIKYVSGLSMINVHFSDS